MSNWNTLTFLIGAPTSSYLYTLKHKIKKRECLMRFKPWQVSVHCLLPVSISMNKVKQIKIIFLISAVLVLLFHFMFGLFMYPQ